MEAFSLTPRNSRPRSRTCTARWPRARRRIPLRDGAAACRTPRLSGRGPRSDSRRARSSRSPASATSSTWPTFAAGEAVLDLGSGSGTDSFFAALLVGAGGRVVGVDFTAEQLAKARRLAAEAGFGAGRVPRGPDRGPARRRPASFDCVISNGVINLSPGQGPGIRRGGAGAAPGRPPGDRRHRQREAAEGDDRLRRRPLGLLHRWRCAAGRLPAGDRGRRPADRGDSRDNPYEFISDRARDASVKYGVKSVSLAGGQDLRRATHGPARRGRRLLLGISPPRRQSRLRFARQTEPAPDRFALQAQRNFALRTTSGHLDSAGCKRLAKPHTFCPAGRDRSRLMERRTLAGR